MRTTAGSKKREKIRREFWSGEDAWTMTNEIGWFRAPRTLPLILQVLNLHEISGNASPGNVYLELLARHIDNGVVEMSSESDHAFAAGYTGSRAVRSWQERMQILEKSGFIKTDQVGNQKYKYVLLVHPTVAMQKLYEQKKVPAALWKAFRVRQIEVKELSFSERESLKTLEEHLNNSKGGEN